MRFPPLPAGLQAPRGPASTLALAHRYPVIGILRSRTPPARTRSNAQRLIFAGRNLGGIFFDPYRVVYFGAFVQYFDAFLRNLWYLGVKVRSPAVGSECRTDLGDVDFRKVVLYLPLGPERKVYALHWLRRRPRGRRGGGAPGRAPRRSRRLARSSSPLRPGRTGQGGSAPGVSFDPCCHSSFASLPTGLPLPTGDEISWGRAGADSAPSGKIARRAAP